MPDVKASVCLDINVFIEHFLSRAKDVRPTASSYLFDCALSGRFPGGTFQLVVSVAMVEQLEDVLRSNLNWSEPRARSAGRLLHRMARAGPDPIEVILVTASRHVPFVTEEQERKAAADELKRRRSGDPERLHDEVQDDMHVFMAAMSKRAGILVTNNLNDFRTGKTIRYEGRDDMFVIPSADHHLVVGRPSFAAHWLREGVAPDWTLIKSHDGDFRRRADSASSFDPGPDVAA